MDLPREEHCLGCHDGRVAPAECATCHDRPDAPMGYAIPSRTLVFTHPHHLRVENVTCLTCHVHVAQARKAGAGPPPMTACFTCHDDVRQSVACVTCHTDAERVRRQIHPPGWRDDHRVSANLDEPSCEACHRTDDRCSLCHFGDNLRGRIHPFNWMDLHAADARARVEDCTSCHDTRAFCVDCHRSRQVRPADHDHPNWLDEHGQEARFDLESCDACHAEAAPGCYRPGCHGG
jgi:hypothetical protein